MAPLFRRKVDDDQAFERIYERHVRDVYRYAAAMLGEAADAEDVTQTTFLNAYRSFQAGTRPDKPRSWLIAIAHNVCRQRFRQAQRRPREVEFDERVAEAAVADPGAPSAQDLRRALSELPPNQRAALVMRELEGSSYTEIAAVLGITVSALETLLFRARRALREQLEERLSCEEAAFAIHKQLEGRLPMSERAGLRAHLRACPECTSLAQSQRAQRRALKSLVLVPLPSGLPHWFGGHASTGAAGAAGAGGLTVAGAATTGGGAAGVGAGASSALLAGAAAKAAAVVAVGAVVGGGYAGTKLVVLPAVHAPSPSAARAAAATGAGPGARPAAATPAFDASRLLVSLHAPGQAAPHAVQGGRSAQAHRVAQIHAAAHTQRAAHGNGADAASRAGTNSLGRLKKTLVQGQHVPTHTGHGTSETPAARPATPARGAKQNSHATVKTAQTPREQPQPRSRAKTPKVDATTTPARTHPAPNAHAGAKGKTADTTVTTDTTEATDTTGTTEATDAVPPVATESTADPRAHPGRGQGR